jgi:5-dehydro-2-deoxygluconokinase
MGLAHIAAPDDPDADLAHVDPCPETICNRLQKQYRAIHRRVNGHVQGGGMQRLWRRMRLNRFAVLGRVGMDLYADPPGTRVQDATGFFPAIGGSAGNIAVALARQGAAAALVSCVSDDAVGEYCLGQLKGYGVDTGHVRLTTGGARTSLAVTETCASDCQTVLYRNNAADFALSETDVAAIDFADMAALIVTGTALAAEPSRGAALLAMARARSAGALVVLDVDYRAYSWASVAEAGATCLQAAEAADIVVGNDDEFGLLAQDHAAGRALARRLAEGGALFTIYKRGAAGAETYTPDDHFATAIYPVQALKPMGAGDGFMAGLLAGLARGELLEAAVRRGAATAAMIVAGVGCAPASPDAAAVEAFMAGY